MMIGTTAHCPKTDEPCTQGCQLGKACQYVLDDDDLFGALAKLNRAAYAAIRAGKDTTAHPDLDRESLRKICTVTDRLVDSQGREGFRDV